MKKGWLQRGGREAGSGGAGAGARLGNERQDCYINHHNLLLHSQAKATQTHSQTYTAHAPHAPPPHHPPPQHALHSLSVTLHTPAPKTLFISLTVHDVVHVEHAAHPCVGVQRGVGGWDSHD